MKKHFLSLLIVLQSVFVWAQIPANYYNSATGLSGTPLRSALHLIIDNHTVKSYSSLYTYYQTTDAKPNNKVWDMYSDVPGGTPPYQFNFSQTCGNYSNEGDCYNREHSWPQSWFNSSSPMVSDLFHVYPTDGKVNGLRSNYPYGEVSTPTTTSLNGSKLGPCSFPGYTGIVFEPIDEYKGDFARTYFYMCTRYYTEDTGWLTNDMITGANLKPWALELMKKWNQQDPVSAKEIARNNTIYGIQGNRNPFIDHPEYVCLIWPGGTYCSIIPSITNIVKTPTTPGIGVATYITATITDDGTISSASLKWGTSLNSLTNTLSMSAGPNNTWTNGTAIPGQVNGTIVYFQIEATDNASNTATSSVQSFTVGTPLSPPPSISNITRIPSNPTVNNPVSITASITDDGSVSSANLTWGTDSNNLSHTISMSSTSGSTYMTTTSIPGRALGDTVYYRINASDNLTQSSTSAIFYYIVKTASVSGCASDIFFSEYLEGTSNNKYLELYNGTGADVNLSDYKISLYANGTSTATSTQTLSGTLINNQVLVLKNSAATVYTGTATVSSVTNFNGDDAIVLSRISTNAIIDIIGRVGEDPGTAWTSGTNSTLNHTLIRKSSVTGGVSIMPTAGFPTLGTEWIVDSVDVATNLGSHTLNCAAPVSTISISNFNSTQVCKGAVINVNFIVNGGVNANNVYTVELSDNVGSFNNATIIGTLTSSNLIDVVNCVIPHAISSGNAYRIRILANNPAIISNDNGQNIIINNLPNVNAGADVQICKGFAAVLNANGAKNYFWDQGAGDTSSVVVMPSETTAYAVTGIDSNGCSSTDTVIVYVTSAETPVITFNRADPKTNMHATLTSSVLTGNTWYYQNVLLPNETNYFVDLEKYGSGNYFCIVVDSNGCVSDTSEVLNCVWEGINSSAYQKINIYPNPNNGEFHIDMNSISKGIYTMEITNSIGQIVERSTFDSNTQNNIKTELNQGVYNIVLKNNKHLYSSVIIIK